MSLQLKPYNRDFAHSYSFGVFPTIELLAARPKSVLKVLANTKGEKNEGVRKLRESCRKRNIPFEVNDKLVERLSPKENSYAVGVFSKYETSLTSDANHITLVNPGDMGNLGTIIRTMLGFGVTELALVRFSPAPIQPADIFDPRVVRASMGALFRVSFEYFDAFDTYQQRFRHNLYPFMTDGPVALTEARFVQPFALIFGNESAGLPEQFNTIGTPVAIRHSPAIDSLSLPIAAGIALYEATKLGVQGSAPNRATCVP